MNIQTTKGQRIKMLRAYLNLSQDQLATMLGININTIRTWENDRAHGLSKKGTKLLCQKIQQFYSLSVPGDWLYNGIGSPSFLTMETHQTIGDSINDELSLFMKSHTNPLYILIDHETDDDFFTKGDLVAGEICENLCDSINKYCIILAENEIYYFGYLENIQNHSLTIKLLDNSKKIIHPPFKMAPVLWCRKPDYEKMSQIN
jgi:transcriptional regulator with XRE-family HTH domain